ncbi:hypothetical protein ONZ45_g19599 [Pleurotus djamor]|nr:hypothetical protein ONZ45_g19599 [Pleurotus djamor]
MEDVHGRIVETPPYPLKNSATPARMTYSLDCVIRLGQRFGVTTLFKDLCALSILNKGDGMTILVGQVGPAGIVRFDTYAFVNSVLGDGLT